jgi:hypothetical protein
MINRKLNAVGFSLVLPTADLTWIEGVTGGGGGGGTPPTFDDFTAQVNGSQTIFTLSATPASNQTVMLVHNGLTLRRGDAFGYTLVGSTITMANAPLAGETLIAWTFTS